MSKKIRRLATPREKKKIVEDTSDKKLLSKIYRNLLKFNSKKTNNPIKKKMSQNLDKCFTSKDVEMTNICMKICFT